MKKFEIINDNWIKILDLNENYSSGAIKIGSIDYISSFSIDEGKTNHINLRTASGMNFSFKYNSIERTQYKEDLAFLENLLFKQ